MICKGHILADQINLNFENGARIKKNIQFLSAGSYQRLALKIQS